MNFLLETLRLGLSNLRLHKMRSLLTSLGIIFGVAAVITMVAIGEGSKRKALEAIERLGARNIIVRSVKPPDTQSATETASFLLDYGIRRLDVRRIEQTVPRIKQIVPVKRVGSEVTYGQYRAPSDVYVGGTLPQLLDILSLHVARGRYLTESDLHTQENVAVIGAEVADRLFPLDDPVGRSIRITARENAQLFKVVGVLRPVGLAGGAGAKLVGRNLNFDVHIPMTAAVARFGDQNLRRSSGSFQGERTELSELYIEAWRDDDVIPLAEKVERVLEAGHGAEKDYTVIVPLELLEKAKRDKAMFNALMIAIASISLLVGGIGIMNIMLASVTERTREIGIRRALGAKQRDVTSQFLIETVVLSTAGGVVGIAVGWAGAWIITELAGWETIVQPWTVAVSFGLSVMVGVFFGMYPAVAAAKLDPIEALRHG